MPLPVTSIYTKYCFSPTSQKKKVSPRFELRVLLYLTQVILVLQKNTEKPST